MVAEGGFGLSDGGADGMLVADIEGNGVTERRPRAAISAGEGGEGGADRGW